MKELGGRCRSLGRSEVLGVLWDVPLGRGPGGESACGKGSRSNSASRYSGVHEVTGTFNRIGLWMKVRP